MWNLSAPCVSKIIVGSPDATSISKVPARVALSAAKASAFTVPSKNASLNSKLDVPKSTSLSVTGAKAPSTNLIWSAPEALNKILLSVAKSISLSASLPTTKLVFVMAPSLTKVPSIVTPDPDVVSAIVFVAIVLPDKAVNVFAVNWKSSAPAIAISIWSSVSAVIFVSWSASKINVSPFKS